MTHLPLPALHELRVAVLTVAGISRLSPACWILLATAIREKTGVTLSEVTLKRLYGFLPSKFPPSPYTTATLARFCGYSDLREWLKWTFPPDSG